MSQLLSRATILPRVAATPFFAAQQVARLSYRPNPQQPRPKGAQKIPPTKRPLYREPTPPPTLTPEALESMPYIVRRTAFAQLPVYRKWMSGGTRQVITVKRVSGDRAGLAAELSAKLGVPPTNIRVNPTTGNIELQVCPFLYTRAHCLRRPCRGPASLRSPVPLAFRPLTNAVSSGRLLPQHKGLPPRTGFLNIEPGGRQHPKERRVLKRCTITIPPCRGGPCAAAPCTIQHISSILEGILRRNQSMHNLDNLKERNDHIGIHKSVHNYHLCTGKRQGIKKHKKTTSPTPTMQTPRAPPSDNVARQDRKETKSTQIRGNKQAPVGPLTERKRVKGKTGRAMHIPLSLHRWPQHVRSASQNYIRYQVISNSFIASPIFAPLCSLPLHTWNLYRLWEQYSSYQILTWT